LIIKKNPSVIYYSDFATGSLLWHIRRFLKFKSRLLLANGAPIGPPFKTEDHVQQLLPVYYSIGIKSDGIASKYTLLPYGFNINTTERESRINDKERIRKESGFFTGQKLVLAVGTINTYHKRMDYIINELARLDESFFLIMLGQEEDETTDLIRLAKDKLPGRYVTKNVSHKETEDYYVAADYFVLASLTEGFPRVTIEALSFGLPCIVHDYIINRQVLQQYGIYIDMRFEGNLSAYLCKEAGHVFNKSDLIHAAHRLYSWEVLKDKYSLMIANQVNVNN
jgi:glycosyltransferase involved in cell wall biosynthesis